MHKSIRIILPSHVFFIHYAKMEIFFTYSTMKGQVIRWYDIKLIRKVDKKETTSRKYMDLASHCWSASLRSFCLQDCFDGWSRWRTSITKNQSPRPNSECSNESTESPYKRFKPYKKFIKLFTRARAMLKLKEFHLIKKKLWNNGSFFK